MPLTPATQFVNSVGMTMVPIPPGEFLMGAGERSFELGPKTDMSKDAPYWDETPVHKVALTYCFFMSRTEVTAEQFRQFRPDFTGRQEFPPWAAGVSWNDAAAFCRWLSDKEGKPYRLPTEAEWEYACRAGTGTMFWCGEQPPTEDINPWGLANMHSAVPEWCMDWHGEYPRVDQADPVGPASGWARVVRGGPVSSEIALGHREGRERLAAAFCRSANRCSLPPDCPQPASQDPPPHFVGFRVVEAPLPATRPLPVRPPFALDCVKQSPGAATGPDPAQPYFKARQLMAVPPDLRMPDDIISLGLDRGNQGKLHSGGYTVCPNGDLLGICFSSTFGKSESAPNATFVVTRLRRGAEQWDMPELFYDLSGLNDQSALLWNDGGRLWFFGGGREFDDVPFRYTTSDDSGATWSELKVPVIVGPRGPFQAQPISHAFRGPDGTIYVACDGRGPTSFLWASRDEGATWFDTLGRTTGRHSVFAVLRDGRILAIGGKGSKIDGYMPKCYSADWARTWSEPAKTPFASQGSNQRPALVRLASGRLFFAADFQLLACLRNPPPPDITQRGAFVALSDDEGETWHIKKLDLARPHDGWNGQPTKKVDTDAATLGYCAAAQAGDGVIHLFTSKCRPAMHFEMNEAWILSGETGEADHAPAEGRSTRESFEQRYPTGALQATWTGRVYANGLYRLDGVEKWFYPTGQAKYEVTWDSGRKVGTETFWAEDGRVLWTRQHHTDGRWTWTQYWPSGQVKSESNWLGLMADGPARLWEIDGTPLTEAGYSCGTRLVPPDP